MFLFLISVQSQTCGDSCEWEYYHDNTTLVIWGSGYMTSYGETSMPWYNQITRMTDVQIYTISSVGEYAFYNFDQLSTVSLPSSLTSIG